LDYFIKVPVKPRLKASSAFIDKALYIKKYQNPYDDLTDKVGMRFVVLLTTDIKKVCQIIESDTCKDWWDASKDRDYEEERLKNPLDFSYQSVHYILRAKDSIEHCGIKIPEGTPCEIQIRTLLQHAHSELTHDTLYKPKIVAKPEIKRTVAKSMALIETTDEFFEQAIQKLDEALSTQRQLLNFLKDAYEKGTQITPSNEHSNEIFIDIYSELTPPAPYTEITDYLDKKDFIFEKIKARIGKCHFFSQPVVLLAYYLVDEKQAQMKNLWEMDNDDLAKIFSDLGISQCL
jgi:ppGpp synthetase/RelA/SpoT-type nucleotidyltranferase